MVGAAIGLAPNPVRELSANPLDLAQVQVLARQWLESLDKRKD
jgi:hypothetical protein